MDSDFVLKLGLVLLASAFGGAIAAPFVRQTARRFGFLDRPDNGRKVHSDPVAYGGGIVLLFAMMAGSAAAWLLGLLADVNVGPLLIFASVIVGAGVWDDGRGMRGRHKLLIQVLVAIGVLASGLEFTRVGAFGFEFEVGIFGKLLVILWVLLSINSFNLIDGVDGLATTVGLIVCVALGVIALLGKEPQGSVVAFALAGGLLVFLPYNCAPSSVPGGHNLTCSWRSCASTWGKSPIGQHTSPARCG